MTLFSQPSPRLSRRIRLAYAVVLLLALSESVLIIGVFISGTAAMRANSERVVKLWPVLSAATAGAIMAPEH